MKKITIELSDTLHQTLVKLSKENHRILRHEIAYRLEQAIKFKVHLNDENIGLFSMLSKVIERDLADESAPLIDSPHH